MIVFAIAHHRIWNSSLKHLAECVMMKSEIFNKGVYFSVTVDEAVEASVELTFGFCYAFKKDTCC